MTPLISANQLEEIINSGENVLLCDCRFDLVDPLMGRKSYEESHIPGAIYVDLDKDLSGAKNGANGRHPLPSPEAWAKQKLVWASVQTPWWLPMTNKAPYTQAAYGGCLKQPVMPMFAS